MEATSNHESDRILALAEALFSRLAANELMLDDAKTLPARFEQMMTGLSKWSGLFTICPHCNDVLLMCPRCDVLFSDYKGFQAHCHECQGVDT